MKQFERTSECDTNVVRHYS